MQSSIKHLLKHFALVLKAKLNQLKPFVHFVFQPSTLSRLPICRIIKGLHIQTFFILLYASFSCPYTASIIPVTSKPVNMHLQRLPIILLFTSVVFINVAFKLLLYLFFFRHPFIPPFAALVKCFGKGAEQFAVCMAVIILIIDLTPKCA